MTEKILIIEDEENIASLLQMYFEKEGWAVDVAPDGETGLVKTASNEYKIILLDIMLPGVDGFEVCSRLREQTQVPVIMLTARDTDIDKVVGLEIGADDYVTKPFNMRELVARVKAVLRRTNGKATTSRIQIGEIAIDLDSRQVFLKDDPVHLTVKEFELLSYLIRNRDKALSRHQILERVWGYEFAGDTRTVDVHVRQLRRKLGGHCPIKTIWGYGYKGEF